MQLLPDHGVLALGIPSGPDMFIIAILVLLLFGPRKLPYFGRSLGISMDEFRRAKEDFEQQLRDAAHLNRKTQADESHKMVNTILYCLFGISVALLIFSLVSRAPH